MKSCHFYSTAQCSSKNSMTLSSFSMTFPWLSMTFAVFHDFQGLENGLPKFHDFPWPGGTLNFERSADSAEVCALLNAALWLSTTTETRPLVAQHRDDDVEMEVVDGEVERRVVVGVLERHVAFPVQQQVHGLHVTAQARVVHRSVLHAHRTDNYFSATLLRKQAQLTSTNLRDAFRDQSRSYRTLYSSIYQVWFPISVLY